MQQFQSLRTRNALHWDSQYEGLRYVGQGGQGVVYHCERAGVDGFRIPIALKAFSPNVYASASDYISDMGRMAEVAMHVSQFNAISYSTFTISSRTTASVLWLWNGSTDTIYAISSTQ